MHFLKSVLPDEKIDEKDYGIPFCQKGMETL